MTATEKQMPEKELSKDGTAGVDGDRADTPAASAEDVAAYLRANPDFFSHHRTLLGDLRLPHASGRAVSLVERQVGILRDRNMEMRKQLHELVEAARHNDTLFAKTRALTLALIECQSLAALNEVLATHMLVDFEADFVCCHLQADARQDIEELDHIVHHPQPPEFGGLLNADAATCTSLRTEELNAVFPLADSEGPGSAVIIPFNERTHLLAIGSRDAGRFNAGMDTLFVSYIADVLSLTLKRLL